MASVLTAYNALLSAGELKPDAEQQAAAQALDALAQALVQQSAQTWLKRFFVRSPPPQSIYLWGKVGRGKSMLMDLFFDSVPIADKRRVHFHAFMLDVHQQLHQQRQSSQGRDDPLLPTARALAHNIRLLCFDEMQVTNIVDATLLGRLFKALLDQGVTIVATSNRPPHDLYKDGLNRDLFLPFIALLEQKFMVLGLNGPTDYRMERMAGVKVYHVPNGPKASRLLSEAFFKLTDHAVEDRAKVPSATLSVQGRSFFVPKSLKGVAVFSFKRLCDSPVGAAEYLAIAQRYHTVIVVGIPQFTPDMHNQATRFITFIDTLYEHKTKLLCSADVSPDLLYATGTGSFEFGRTVSRLVEMQSADYLSLGHGMALPPRA